MGEDSGVEMVLRRKSLGCIIGSASDRTARNQSEFWERHGVGSLAASMEIERGNSFTSEADVTLNAVRETKYNRIRFDASYEGDRTKDKSSGKSTTTERDLGSRGTLLTSRDTMVAFDASY